MSMRSPTWSELSRDALRDLVQGALCWRVWMHLGLNEIRGRYRRSIIGQNWQTLSMAVLLGAIALIYSGLLQVDGRVYVVHLVCAFSCWILINGLVVDSAYAYINSEGLLRNYHFPRSVAIYQLIGRNLTIFAHNIVLIVPIFMVTGHPFSWTMVLIIPALMLYALNAVWVAILLGALCARFRDVPQVVTSGMQIAVILTPVMYMLENVSGRQLMVVEMNPLTRFLQIGRDALIGKVPRLEDYAIVLIITALGLAVGLYVFARTRRRIIYWL